MLTNLFRDRATMPIIDRLMSPYDQFLAAAVEILLAGRGPRGRSRVRVRAAIGHALDFTTWRDLARARSLDDEAAAELMSRLVAAAG
jgi:hypothetical protein